MFSESIVTIVDTIQFFPKAKTCLGFSRVNIVRCLTIVGAICFKNVDEMLSNPVLLLVVRLNIVLITINSST